MDKRLRQLLEILNIKQKEFANSIEVSPSHISDILTGRRNGFSMEVLINMANIYGVNLNWLLTGDGEMFVHTSQNTHKPEQGCNIPELEQIKDIKWFKNLTNDQREILAGLSVIKDVEILKKFAEIISSQVKKEKAEEEFNRGLGELTEILRKKENK